MGRKKNTIDGIPIHSVTRFGKKYIKNTEEKIPSGVRIRKDLLYSVRHHNINLTKVVADFIEKINPDEATIRELSGSFKVAKNGAKSSLILVDKSLRKKVKKYGLNISKIANKSLEKVFKIN